MIGNLRKKVISMGCWNATCNISHLPIQYQDKIVLILLINGSNKHTTNTCYATDNFQQFAMPIRGEYDDYGGIKNIETSLANENLIKSYQYYQKIEQQGTEQFQEIENCNDFEELVNTLLDNTETYYVKSECMFHNTNMHQIDYFMIHEDLYDALISEISQRKPYQKTNTIKELIFEKYKNAAEKYDKTYPNGISYENHVSELLLQELTITLFCHGSYSLRTYHWDIMTKEYLQTKNEKILHLAVEKFLFGNVLDLLRMGFHCTSGAGSQSQETKMHYIMASFILNYIEKEANKAQEENGITPEEYKNMKQGIDETIFYHEF